MSLPRVVLGWCCMPSGLSCMYPWKVGWAAQMFAFLRRGSPHLSLGCDHPPSCTRVQANAGVSGWGWRTWYACLSVTRCLRLWPGPAGCPVKGIQPLLSARVQRPGLASIKCSTHRLGSPSSWCWVSARYAAKLEWPLQVQAWADLKLRLNTNTLISFGKFIAECYRIRDTLGTDIWIEGGLYACIVLCLCLVRAGNCTLHKNS